MLLNALNLFSLSVNTPTSWYFVSFSTDLIFLGYNNFIIIFSLRTLCCAFVAAKPT